jgi:hypothetical protein
MKRFFFNQISFATNNGFVLHKFEMFASYLVSSTRNVSTLLGTSAVSINSPLQNHPWQPEAYIPWHLYQRCIYFYHRKLGSMYHKHEAAAIRRKFWTTFGKYMKINNDSAPV